MSEQEHNHHDGRLDTMLPGVPISAKVCLLAGAAGGLFAAIVFSYVDDSWQYHALAAGLFLGGLGALIMTLRNRHAYHDS